MTSAVIASMTNRFDRCCISCPNAHGSSHFQKKKPAVDNSSMTAFPIVHSSIFITSRLTYSICFDLSVDARGLLGDAPSCFPRVLSTISHFMDESGIYCCVVSGLLLAHYMVHKITITGLSATAVVHALV